MGISDLPEQSSSVGDILLLCNSTPTLLRRARTSICWYTCVCAKRGPGMSCSHFSHWPTGGSEKLIPTPMSTLKPTLSPHFGGGPLALPVFVVDVGDLGMWSWTE